MSDKPSDKPWHVHLHLELSPMERRLAKFFAWAVPASIVASAIIEGHL